MNNKSKSNKYWAEIEVNGGIVKFVRANKLTALNQYKNTWRRTDSRNLARKVNRADIVIK